METNPSVNVTILTEADTPRARQVLPPRLLELIGRLHREFEPERQTLLEERRLRQARFDAGELPGYLEDHPAHHSDWRVAQIPDELLDRRVEITGPANQAKMVIQMLNGTPEIHADTAMLDFEDSMCPTWANVVDAVHNIIGAARGDLTYVQESDGKTYSLKPADRALMMVRVRGLHMDERHVQVDGKSVSAGLFDLVVSAFQTADHLIRADKTPKYYVPKCEHYLEARWWNRLFSRLEKELELPPGTLRVTFLIETLPAAFQMEEILYEIRSRACGLNVGRWDKIFSDIKVLRNHPDRILADRASIDMTRPWMENYARRLIRVCHRRGAFAMGGMAASTPGRTEALRKEQTEKVRADKAREASMGHDGCWVSHPYFIAIARSEFKRKNQLDVLLPDSPDRPDLLPRGGGPRTEQGLRKNLRVGIAYMNGWMNGIGCVAFDNLMEDLATLEISRAQVWQWLHHEVILDDGTRVTRERVEQLIDEELEEILFEEDSEQSYREAANEVKNLFLQEELADFLEEGLWRGQRANFMKAGERIPDGLASGVTTQPRM